MYLKPPLHHVVFSPTLKDRMQATGRTRGGKLPGRNGTFAQEKRVLGPNLVYAEISESLRRLPVAASMRVDQHARA